jgi:Trk K+ transport system NAD-binding subunit
MLADMDSGVDLIDGVMTNRALAGRSLRRVRFPGGVLVMGIRRGGEALIPNGATVLEMGDVLVLAGNQEALKKAERLVRGR